MRRIGEGVRAGVRRLFVPDKGGDDRSRRDMQAELRAHVDSRVEYLVARGRDAEAARRDALARFGGDIGATIALLEESSMNRDRTLDMRDRIGQLLHDWQFIVRGLGRSPAFTAGVIATLALGLGINSAVFRVADRVLFRAPSGVEDAGALRRVSTLAPQSNAPPLEIPNMSYPEARLLLSSGAFTRAAMYTSARTTRLVDGREVAAAYTDSGFFATLGVRAAAGRLYDAQEAQPGASLNVVVVSYDFWTRELGGAAFASIPPLVLNDKSYRVVGATPRGFTGIDLDPIDIWLPFGTADLGHGYVNGVTMPWYTMQNLRGMFVIGRKDKGASDERVAAQGVSGVASLDRNEGRPARTLLIRSIVAPRTGTNADSGDKLIARLAIVAIIVLLIACANAANLLLARALRRRREIAVRIAIGARRAHIVRLLILESTMLGIGGGITAGLVGYWTGNALRALLFPGAKWSSSAFDDRTLAFTLLIALAAGLVAGLAPALQLTNPDVLSALKDVRHQPGKRSHRTRAALVVLQTAFSLMLVIGSGLLVRSLQKLNAVNIGFVPEGLVTAAVPGTTFMGRLMDPALITVAGRVSAVDVADRLRTAPGVREIALASSVPFGAHSSMGISVPGHADPQIPQGSGPWYIAVSPNYFSVMGTKLLRGRAFAASDNLGSDPVVVVGETMAKYYWPDGNAFASCILLNNATCARVVGIVEDVRDTRGGGVAPVRFYLPLPQFADSAAAVIVRTTPERAPSIAAFFKASIPAAQRPTIEIISDRVNVALRPWRLAGILFSVLGGVALLLACVGVYSVMSYIASERVHELGVRVVLGATPFDIVRLVLSGGIKLVAVGSLLGLIGALGSARLLSALLFDVSPFDPAVYLIALAALTAIAVTATLVPAVRVMHADPTVALRAE